MNIDLGKCVGVAKMAMRIGVPVLAIVYVAGCASKTQVAPAPENAVKNETVQPASGPRPKDAVRAMHTACFKGDVAAAWALLVGRDEAEKQLTEPAAELAVEMAAFNRALAARFGDEAAAANPYVDHTFTDDLANARETIDGDTATVGAEGDDSPLQLISMDGAWRFVVTRFLGSMAHAGADAIRARAQTFRTAAVDVTAGKYASADAALDAVLVRAP